MQLAEHDTKMQRQAVFPLPNNKTETNYTTKRIKHFTDKLVHKLLTCSTDIYSIHNLCL